MKFLNSMTIWIWVGDDISLKRGPRKGFYCVRIRIQNKMCIESNSRSFTEWTAGIPLLYPVLSGLPENTYIEQGQKMTSWPSATHTVHMNFPRRLVSAAGNKWIVLMEVIITAPKMCPFTWSRATAQCVLCVRSNEFPVQLNENGRRCYLALVLCAHSAHHQRSSTTMAQRKGDMSSRVAAGFWGKNEHALIWFHYPYKQRIVAQK